MLPVIQRIAGFLGLCPAAASEVEILCLAWSRKRGGRCLAGLRMDGGGWVRPVGHGLDGMLPDGADVGVLEVVRISLCDAYPKPHQPENWRLRQVWYNPWYKPYRRVDRPPPEGLADWLAAQSYAKTMLFGNQTDRVGEDQFAKGPVEASLALIEPESLRWLIKTGLAGERRQVRAVFQWANTIYNLAVTDSAWEQRLNDLAPGCQEHMALCQGEQKKVFLTISLGEPFCGDCYKLVAAVILI